MTIRKAERKRAKLRLGVAGPGGSGKTYSALLLAFGLGGKVGMIDTEAGSGDLYAHLGDYDIINITPPYTIAKYLAGIRELEAAQYSTIIIDSLSHAWAGEGGLLDKQGKIADSGKGNSYTAWRTVTPEHNALVEAMLGSPCHIIATMRSKTEYVQDKDDKGKTVVRKVGMSPIQRDGLEYEFSVMLDLTIDHTASVSKDRTSIFDGTYFRITSDTGKTLLSWLNTGSEPTPPAPPEPPPDHPSAALPTREAMMIALHKASVRGLDALKAVFSSLPPCAEKTALWEEHQNSFKELAAKTDGANIGAVDAVDISQDVPQ